MERMICDNLNAQGATLYFAGQSCPALAARYGTPLYLMDEDRIRQNCRAYTGAARAAFGDGFRILYASKAAAFVRMAEIIREEGLYLDVVSAGEIATAVKAGFPMANVYFHGSVKTDADIAFAMNCGVGYFVIDSVEELYAVEAEAARRSAVQPVLLRLTPGIDPHTYAAVATGLVDSKFGVAIETGQAEAFLETALSLPHLDVAGLHCHVGSQVFDADVFVRSAAIMLDFMTKAKAQFGFAARQLDLGGGYGVRYTADDPALDLAKNLREIAAFVRRGCEARGLSMPVILFEPGRSIVADAGLTLYTVGPVKKIPGVRNYVSVDGGMTDNPRYALYGAPYTVLPATRMDEPRDMTATVAGRCCESGDVIQPDVPLPASLQSGDLLAVCTTGAYHYSMASNYNRLPRPPIVMLKGGTSYVAVRRETLDDLLQLDV